MKCDCGVLTKMVIGTCKYSLWFTVYKLSVLPLIHPHSVVQAYNYNNHLLFVAGPAIGKTVVDFDLK